MTPRRYQLTKHAVAIIARGHPWIFRDQLSSAARVFRDGDWLSLVDGANRVVAHGIFEAEGAIAIRILRRGPARPDAAWLADRLAAALARREPLASRTDGIRLLHGESDGIPAVVADRFGPALVVTSYSAGADALARYAAHALGRTPFAVAAAGITSALIRPAHRRLARPAPSPSPSAPSPSSPSAPSPSPSSPAGPSPTPASPAARAVRGIPPAVARFTEDGLAFSVDLVEGQKTGTYLDLRGLRRAIATAPLAGARVLNLFAYTGMLGRAAEAAGATSILQVDTSERALAFAAAHHVVDPSRHRFVTADVFAWLPALPPDDRFDLVIVDPPSMTSRKAQVPSVLAAYRKLYLAAAPHVLPGGALVAACCTSRIPRATFHGVVRDALGPAFTLERELSPEPDHPVGFPEADYLKLAWWRRLANPGDPVPDA